MGKRTALENFIVKANALELDYGMGTKALPLISQLPSDPVGLYTTNVPLLHIPLIGDIDHAGEKFKYAGVTTPAPVQNTEWGLVPKALRSDLNARLHSLSMGQGGDNYDPRRITLVKVDTTAITADTTQYLADQEKETI